MRYYIIAGEKSGDLHGSNLIKSLKQQDSQAEIRCFGGDEMRKAGGNVVMHIRDMAFMGFLEVALNLRKILGILSFCKKDIVSFQPDVVILIDYAGFNMRIARFARRRNLKVFYYISPKVWAWNQSRALKIKKYVDRMFVILPFEKAFFARYDYAVDYVGNPLLDAVREHQVNVRFREDNQLDGKPVIAVLPGSRKQEIEQMLGIMTGIVATFPDFNFVVAGVDHLPREYYRIAEHTPGLYVVYNQTYDLLSHAHAAVVASGTATLETALFEVPQVVCYRTSYLSYAIASRLIKVDYISLVNLIAGKEVVRELIQDDLNSANLTRELQKISGETAYRNLQLQEYQRLKEQLGDNRTSSTLAKLIIGYLGKSASQRPVPEK